MNVIKIKDNTFDYKKFKNLITYLNRFSVIETLRGKDFVYVVQFAGQNHMGYIHLVKFLIENQYGFNLYLYENQSLKYKGHIVFRVFDKNFNIKQEKTKLKNLGYDKIDTQKWRGFLAISISLIDLNDCLFNVFKMYDKYIFQ